MTSTTPLVAISTSAVLIWLILMAGSIWWAILLLKDAKKHKKFSKIMRMISGIIQLAAIVGSIIITIILFSNVQSVSMILKLIINILLGISLLAIITNTRGAILLFIQSRKAKKFQKWIRIICGVFMILALFSSLISGL
jgi:hypothetical protein